MFEDRNLRHDLFALSLAALVVFFTTSLVTHDAADPLGEMLWPVSLVYQPQPAVYPAHEAVTNFCGRLGAIVSDVAVGGLGFGAWYLAVTLAAVSVLMLIRREIKAPAVRTFGWLVSLVGLTSLMSLCLSSLGVGPAIGPGGYLGAMGSGFLLSHFATIGAVILALTITAAGLLLCTDYVLLQIAIAVGLPVARGVSRGVKTQIERRRALREARLAARSEAQRGTKKRAHDDLNVPVADDEESGADEQYEVDEEVEAEDEVEEPAGPRIKFLGRSKQSEADEKEEELEDETAEEDDAEEYEEDDASAEEEELEEEEEDIIDEPVQSVPAPKFLTRVKKPQKKTKQDERDEVMHHLDAAAADLADPEDYELPPMDLLLEGDDFTFEAQEKEVLQKARILENTFKSFGFNVRVVEIETGPVIAQYEIELEAGLRLAKITNLADDLAIALRVPSVRIVAPIPGKNTVGIEVPNTNRQMVRLRDVMEESEGARVKKMQIPIYLGKDVSGHPMVEDLARMPHLLIAGRTGTGKSVCLNAIISSMLMTRRPDEVRMLMIDPKMVELSGYGSLPHLMHPVVTDMRKAEAILAWAVEKMEERYSLLAKAGVRQISSYNQLGEEELFERMDIETEEDKAAVPLHLPYIVIVADEIADMMMVAGKEVEQHIIRLAQKSRAVGIHLILATQKPTVDVITGLIKSNLPARLSFQVASRTDSRVVLDEMGADKLLGDGDMLFLKPGTSQLLRGQGTYLSDEEIDSIVGAVSTGEQNFVQELVQLKPKDQGEAATEGGVPNRDELYEAAIDVVVREQRGSVSLLQRNLGIGYGRAARLIDFMAEDGIVGQYAGSQARDVLLTMEDWERMQAGEGAPSSADSVASLNADVASAQSAAKKKTSQTEEEESTSRKKKTKSNATAAKESSAAVRRPRTNRIIPVPDYGEEEDELEEANEELEDEIDEEADEYEGHGDAEVDDEEYDEEADYDEEQFEDEESAEWEEDEYEEEEVA